VEADPCVFCQILAGEAPATIKRQTSLGAIIVPIRPVVEGHVLAIPRLHSTDFAANRQASLDAMHLAWEWAKFQSWPDVNLITSRGVHATQSVFHLHIHLVPRAENDGLALPWYSGRSKRKAEVGG